MESLQCPNPNCNSFRVFTRMMKIPIYKRNFFLNFVTSLHFRQGLYATGIITFISIFVFAAIRPTTNANVEFNLTLIYIWSGVMLPLLTIQLILSLGYYAKLPKITFYSFKCGTCRYAWYFYAPYRREPSTEIQFFEAALALARKRSNKLKIATSLTNLAIIVGVFQNDWPHAQVLVQEALELYEKISDKKGYALCLRSLGVTLICLGQLDQAHPVLEKSIALFRELGD